MLPGFSAGWDELVKRFRTDIPPDGEVSTGNTIQIGTGLFAPIYRNCTKISALRDGLYLWPSLLGIGRASPVVIPWKEIRRVEPATIYWSKSARLVIGDPEVTSVVVSSTIFGKIRNYLDPSAVPPTGL